MTHVWGWIFLGINLLVRVPIRIAIRCFKIASDSLAVWDLIATLAAGVSFLGLCICALIEGEIETGLAIACIVLFGGILLLITGAWLYVQIKERIENKESIQRAIAKAETQAKKPIATESNVNKDMEPKRLDKLETRLSRIRLVAIVLCIILILSLNWLSESVFAHQVCNEYTTQEPYEYVSGSVWTYVCYTTTYGSCYHADYCGYLWSSSHKTTVYEAERRDYDPCSQCTPYEETEIILKNYGFRDVKHTEWGTEPASKFWIWSLGTAGIWGLYFLVILRTKKQLNALRKSLELP